MAFLFIDFGASRVKTALYSDNQLQNAKDFPPAIPINSFGKHVEVSPNELIKLFHEIVNEYFKYSLKGIFICSEMHGFALQDQDNNIITNYISWKDNRAIEKIDEISTLDFIQQKLPNFKQHTGMKIRSDLPAVNFLHLIRSNMIPQGSYKMIALPEIFGAKHIHNTLLAGLGIWDIYKQDIYSELQDLYSEFGYTISTNIPSNNIVKTSEYNRIPIYTAVGDNQCALYGVKLQEDQLILNLGTGSQVAYIDQLSPLGLLDQRPYFNNSTLSVITHIPSGRALNCFMKFLEECISFGGGNKNPWSMLAEITIEDLQQAPLNFDLSVFESAYQFNNGGSILGIMEKEFTIKTYLSSLLRSYIHQYINIIQRYKLTCNNMILSGGIPQKLPIIKQYLEYILGCSIKLSTNSPIDETLLGLQCLYIDIKENL